jgi:hypothetical protein
VRARVPAGGIRDTAAVAHDALPPCRVAREYTVVDDQILVWPRDECCELRGEVNRFVQDVSGAIGPGGLQLERDPSVGKLSQPVLRDRWASAVA